MAAVAVAATLGVRLLEAAAICCGGRSLTGPGGDELPLYVVLEGDAAGLAAASNVGAAWRDWGDGMSLLCRGFVSATARLDLRRNELPPKVVKMLAKQARGFRKESDDDVPLELLLEPQEKSE